MPDYDDGRPEVIVISRRDVRARVTHRCDDCPEPITPGSLYVRTCLKVDGEMTVTTTHSASGACAWRP